MGKVKSVWKVQEEFMWLTASVTSAKLEKEMKVPFSSSDMEATEEDQGVILAPFD